MRVGVSGMTHLSLEPAGSSVARAGGAALAGTALVALTMHGQLAVRFELLPTILLIQFGTLNAILRPSLYLLSKTFRSRPAQFLWLLISASATILAALYLTYHLAVDTELTSSFRAYTQQLAQQPQILIASIVTSSVFIALLLRRA